MNEIILSLHMHTIYSDGSGKHIDLAKAAVATGIDAILVTDHNVLVKDFERVWHFENGNVLMLVGEEIHDQTCSPQKNHLLVFNTEEELAHLAQDTQNLIDTVRQKGGLTFLAHPYDPECPPINEGDISWENWDVHGYNGIELWNSLSDLKIRSRTFTEILFYIFFPKMLNIAPPKQHMQIWNELHSKGQRVVALGGADAHAIKVQRGPLKREVFPYEFHFKGITTHLLLSESLTANVTTDRNLIFSAMEQGHCFVANDLFSPARGFSFKCEWQGGSATMGDEVMINQPFTLKIILPKKAECQLLKDGMVLRTWNNHEQCVYPAKEPGVYRVEVYHTVNRRRLGWIYSNPIYIRPAN